jgi:predicted metal-dependent peptidase
MPKLSAEQRLLKARLHFLQHQPFVAVLAMSFPIKANEGVQTMAVSDAGVIYYNPEFIDSLDFDALCGFYAHVVMHIALYHITRCGIRDPALWDLASDIFANYVVANMGLKLPQGAVEAPTIAKTLTTEEVYDLLAGDGLRIKGKLKCDGIQKTGKGLTLKVKKELEQKIKEAIANAATHGTLPANFGRLFGLQDSTLNWRQLLERFVSAVFSLADYSWVRPQAWPLIKYNYYAPSLEHASLNIVIGVDTSGSISDADLTTFVSEIYAIHRAYPESHLYILACDADVHEVYQDFNEFMAKNELGGGGGTDFRPVFEYVEKNLHDPTAIVFFTDGEGEYPAQPVKMPTLWVLTREYEVPFGEKTVFIREEQNE